MNKYLKLLADNRKKGFFRAQAPIKAEAGDETTLYLYDAIVSGDLEAEYWGGVSPQSFVKTLSEIKSSVIHLRINSPGGDVFAARSIEQALREHPAKVIAHIDGFAASAASFIAMAADEIVMNEGGFFMIHKAWTIAWGNENDLIDTAELLAKIDGSLVNTYAKRTGQKAEDIAQWMADETWMSAQESVDRGFADRIDTGTKADASAAEWDLSAYAKAPAAPQAASQAIITEPVLQPAPLVDTEGGAGGSQPPQAAPTPAQDEPARAITNVDHLRRKLQLIAPTA